MGWFSFVIYCVCPNFTVFICMMLKKKTKLFLSLTAEPRPGSKLKTLTNPPWTCGDQPKCPHFAGEMLTM